MPIVVLCIQATLNSKIDLSNVLQYKKIRETYLTDFYFLNQEKMISEQTELGEYGVTVPLSTLEKFDFNAIPENTMVLVPGLAFDKKGNRLGKGKGYYDKFLQKLLSSPTKENILGFVGYCYDFQIIEKVITEENDIPVNYVVSDQNILEIS